MNFSVSWRSDAFLLVLVSICAPFLIVDIVLLVVVSVLIKREQPIVRQISYFASLAAYFITEMFYIPFTLTFVGGLLCWGNGDKFGISCGSGTRTAINIVGLIAFAIHFVVSFIIRLFVYNCDWKKGGFFTTQSGLYSATMMFFMTLVSFLFIFLNGSVVIPTVVGMIIFLFLAGLAVIVQPFFNPWGNVFWAAGWTAVAVTYLFGLITSVADMSVSGTKVFAQVLFWIAFAASFVGFPFLVGFFTLKLAKREWAMRPGEAIPRPYQKKEQMTVLSSNVNVPTSFTGAPINVEPDTSIINLTSSTTLSGGDSLRKGPIISPPTFHGSGLDYSSKPITPVTSTLPTISPLASSSSSSSSSGLPSTPASNEKRVDTPSKPIIMPTTIHPPKPAGSGSPYSSTPYQSSTLKSSMLNPSSSLSMSEGKPLLSEQAMPEPKMLPKYRSVSQVQHAIRFLSVRDLRKRQDCTALAESILLTGQKRFPSSSPLYLTVGLFHDSFTKNSMRMGDAIRSAKQCIPTMVERFMIYSLLHDIERKHSSKSGSGRDTLGVTFRIQFAKGTKAHETAKAYLQQAYLLLSKENMDLEKIMLFLEKAIVNEEEAHKTFQEMLKLNPNSIQLLRAFGALLRDIYRNDDTATMLFTEANMLEEDQTSQTRSASYGDEMASRASKLSKVSKASSILQAGGGLDDLQAEEAKKKKKKKRSRKAGSAINITEDKQNLLPFFLPLIVVCVGIVIVCLIIDFVLVFNTFTECSTTVTTIISCARTTLALYKVYIYAMFYNVRLSSESKKDNYTIPKDCIVIPAIKEIRENARILSETLGTQLEEAYRTTLTTAQFQRWEFEYINQVWLEYDVVQNNDGEYEGKFLTDELVVGQINLIDLIANINNICNDIYYFWNTTDTRLISKIYYIEANVPLNAGEALKQLSVLFSNTAQEKANKMMIVSLVIGISSLVIPVFILLVQYVSTVRKLMKERRMVMLDICSASKEDILRLKKRLDDLDKDNDEDATLFSFQQSTVETENSLNSLDNQSLASQRTKNSNSLGVVQHTITDEDEAKDHKRRVKQDNAAESLHSPHTAGSKSQRLDSNSVYNSHRSFGLTQGQGPNVEQGMNIQGDGKTHPMNQLMMMDALNKQMQSQATPGLPIMPMGAIPQQPILMNNIMPNAVNPTTPLLLAPQATGSSQMMDPTMFQSVIDPSGLFGLGTEMGGQSMIDMNNGNHMQGMVQNPIQMQGVNNGALPKDGAKADDENADGGADNEDHAANAANKEEDDAQERERERLREQQEDARIELENRIKKLNNVIPVAFYLRVVGGSFLIIASVIVFYVVSILAITKVVAYNNSIFLADYRSSILTLMAVTSMILGVPNFPTLPSNNYTTDYATNPVWNDLSHLSNDQTKIQNFCSKILQFFTAIDVRVNFGSDYGTDCITNDEVLDALELKATVVDGSDLVDLMHSSTNCLMEDKTVCEEDPDRLYSITGDFNGLQFLVERFKTATAQVAHEDLQTHPIDLTYSAVQIAASLIVYDLLGGYEEFRAILEKEQIETVDEQEKLLIIFFILAISVSLISSFVCLVPTRGVLFSVARTSAKIHELDPASDAAERTGMGQAAWKEEYSADCNRLDKMHQRILLHLAVVCGAIDNGINIKDQLEEFRAEASDEFKKVLALYDSYCSPDSNNKNNAQQNNNSNPNDQGAVEKNKKKADAILKLLQWLVKATFTCFADEELIIHKYKIAKTHRKGHYSSHASFIKKIQQQSLHIGKAAKSKKDNYVINQSFSSSLSQVYIGWLTEHVVKYDRELSALLIGKAPPSELDKDVNLSVFKIPFSYTQYLDSDNASLQEKNMFEKLKKLLHLND